MTEQELEDDLGPAGEAERASPGAREVWKRAWGWGGAAGQAGWGQME